MLFALVSSRAVHTWSRTVLDPIQHICGTPVGSRQFDLVVDENLVLDAWSPTLDPGDVRVDEMISERNLNDA